jgi:hypothetical protein
LDIEQLKLILETLGAAGEGTKELALIYFGYLLIKAIGVAAIFATLFLVIYRVAMAIVRAVSLEGRLVDALSLSYMSPSKMTEVIEWAKRGRGMN